MRVELGVPVSTARDSPSGLISTLMFLLVFSFFFRTITLSNDLLDALSIFTQ